MPMMMMMMMSLHKKKWNVVLLLLLLLRISTTSSFFFFFLRVLDEKEERYSSLSSQPSPSSWSQKRTKKSSLSLSLSLLFFVCLFSPSFFFVVVVVSPFEYMQKRGVPCTHSHTSPNCALTRVLCYALKDMILRKKTEKNTPTLYPKVSLGLSRQKSDDFDARGTTVHARPIDRARKPSLFFFVLTRERESE